ncbi:MAG: hypothetical protein ACPIOQ_41365, partial [Promethearchaeia archaeon]
PRPRHSEAGSQSAPLLDPRLPDLPSHMQAQTPSTPSGATDLEQSTTSPTLDASRGARSHTLRASLTFPQMRPSLRERFSESLPALLDGEQDGLGDASLDVSGALTTASILRGQQAVTNTVEDLVTAVLLCLVSGQNLLVNLIDDVGGAMGGGHGRDGEGDGVVRVCELIRRVFGVDVCLRRFTAGVSDLPSEAGMGMLHSLLQDAAVVGGKGRAREAPAGTTLQSQTEVVVLGGTELLPEVEQIAWEESSAALAPGWGGAGEARGHEGPRPIVVAVCKEGWGALRQPFRDRYLINVSLSGGKLARVLSAAQVLPRTGHTLARSCARARPRTRARAHTHTHTQSHSQTQTHTRPHSQVYPHTAKTPQPIHRAEETPLIPSATLKALQQRFAIAQVHLAVSRYTRDIIAVTRQGGAELAGCRLSPRGAFAASVVARALAVCDVLMPEVYA